MSMKEHILLILIGDDENEPIIKDTNPNTYENPTGTIFITVGT